MILKVSGGGGGGDASFEEGQFAMVTATNVSAVKDTRDHERKEMQDLNERFANYIEKVGHPQSPTHSRTSWYTPLGSGNPPCLIGRLHTVRNCTEIGLKHSSMKLKCS